MKRTLTEDNPDECLLLKLVPLEIIQLIVHQLDGHSLQQWTRVMMQVRCFHSHQLLSERTECRRLNALYQEFKERPTLVSLFERKLASLCIIKLANADVTNGLSIVRSLMGHDRIEFNLFLHCTLCQCCGEKFPKKQEPLFDNLPLCIMCHSDVRKRGYTLNQCRDIVEGRMHSDGYALISSAVFRSLCRLPNGQRVEEIAIVYDIRNCGGVFGNRYYLLRDVLYYIRTVLNRLNRVPI